MSLLLPFLTTNVRVQLPPLIMIQENSTLSNFYVKGVNKSIDSSLPTPLRLAGLKIAILEFFWKGTPKISGCQYMHSSLAPY